MDAALCHPDQLQVAEHLAVQRGAIANAMFFVKLDKMCDALSTAVSS